MANRLSHGLTRLNDALEKLLVALGLLFLLVFCSMTGLELFGRALFSTSFPWSSEIARITFLWSVYVGAAVGFRHQEHLQLDIVRFKAGSKMATLHDGAIYLSTLGYLLLFAITGVMTLIADVARNYPVTGISFNWGYASLIAMGAFGTLFVLEVTMKWFLHRQTISASELNITDRESESIIRVTKE